MLTGVESWIGIDGAGVGGTMCRWKRLASARETNGVWTEHLRIYSGSVHPGSMISVFENTFYVFSSSNF